MSRNWNVALLKSRANGMSRRWDVAQLKFRANKISRKKVIKKSRKWCEPLKILSFTHLVDLSRQEVKFQIYAFPSDLTRQLFHPPGRFKIDDVSNRHR